MIYILTDGIYLDNPAAQTASHLRYLNLENNTLENILNFANKTIENISYKITMTLMSWIKILSESRINL